MKKYRHVIFDLDRTLWDFERNSRETFGDLHIKYNLQKQGVGNLDEFYEAYTVINHALWDEYRKGLIEKDFLNVERFRRVLLLYRIDDREMAAQMAHDYVSISPTKKHLFEGAVQLLEYLKDKGYALHILTNGFREVQRIKIYNSGFEPFFDEVIISEETGFKKPAPEIFAITLERTGAAEEEAVMVGDDISVDIEGAKNAGIDGIWVNHNGAEADFEPDYEVRDLLSIREIL